MSLTLILSLSNRAAVVCSAIFFFVGGKIIIASLPSWHSYSKEENKSLSGHTLQMLHETVVGTASFYAVLLSLYPLDLFVLVHIYFSIRFLYLCFCTLSVLLQYVTQTLASSAQHSARTTDADPTTYTCKYICKVHFCLRFVHFICFNSKLLQDDYVSMERSTDKMIIVSIHFM